MYIKFILSTYLIYTCSNGDVEMPENPSLPFRFLLGHSPISYLIYLSGADCTCMVTGSSLPPRAIVNYT